MSSSSSRNTVITARVPRAIADRLRGAAIATNRTVSSFVADLVIAALTSTRPPSERRP